MDGELKALASQFPKLNVIFPGFFNQNELPKLFGACDIFALPSRNEPWGLIINEAMCAALPIVASREIGSVADLLQEGINGHAFDARDVEGLINALRPIVANIDVCKKMGAASRAIISGWGYQQCLEGLVDALKKSNVVNADFRSNAFEKTD
jgi:glycosyltransferase involved in cell wall biosynthesis